MALLAELALCHVIGSLPGDWLSAGIIYLLPGDLALLPEELALSLGAFLAAGRIGSLYVRIGYLAGSIGSLSREKWLSLPGELALLAK